MWTTSERRRSVGARGLSMGVGLRGKLQMDTAEWLVYWGALVALVLYMVVVVVALCCLLLPFLVADPLPLL